nr:hypothetical protein [Deltaproteobacteria bacterium]
MRKTWVVLVSMLVLSAVGCGSDLSGTNDFLTFSIGSENAVIGEDSINLVVPAGTDLTALVPTFTTDGTKVVANGVAQISGESVVDFTGPVTYRVIAENLTTHDYAVVVQSEPSMSKELTSFVFHDATNVDLSADALATINGNLIAATVPFGTNVTALVATFVHGGATVTVGGTVQESGLTPNNFTSPVTYTVTAADGGTRAYVITVTVAPSPAKDLTAFAFLDASNTALAADVTATINGTAIAVTVPFGTDVTALVATFTTTGPTVTVGGAVQVSGTSANDFASPVSYVVTAADGSARTYTVTVMIVSAEQKDITSFSFRSANNAALTADVTATINGTSIAVTVPTGTNVSALVATFSHTGVAVAIGATPQVSEVTANDFASPRMYVVTGGDTLTKTYTVTVTVALGSAKDITAYALLDSSNPALSADITATINGTAITATVPFGTDRSALVATFSHTGSSVSVGVIPQTSGITTNDFTNSVVYTVTAADTSTKTYNVTIVQAANTAKTIDVFTFQDATNPALSADVTATITGTSIMATVPFGTDRSALVATFTSAAASVRVGTTTQASGVTPNNFTSPVSYVVTAGDTTTQIYTVTVSVAASPAKDITAFSFRDTTNPALPIDVIATITGTSITANVPPGTDLGALVATFSTTGAGVTVGVTAQASGITPNDFTNPVTYLVTAADATTQAYTVTVRTMRRFAVPRLRLSAPGSANPVTSTVQIVYGRMTAPTAARVDVRVYTDSGDLMTGPTAAVCDPCGADLTGTARGLTVDLGVRAAAAGITTDVDAYAIVDISGDVAAVSVTGRTSTQVGAGNTVLDQMSVVEPPGTATQRLLFGPTTEAPGVPT